MVEPTQEDITIEIISGNEVPLNRLQVVVKKASRYPFIRGRIPVLFDSVTPSCVGRREGSMRNLISALAIVCGLLIATTTLAVTTIPGGTITTDTVWGPGGTPADNVYYIQSSINVRSGATLTIEAGTELRFNTASALTFGAGGTAGRLIAIGTSSNLIVLTSNNNAVGGWIGLDFTNDSDIGGVTSSLTYCRIEKGGSTGFQVRMTDSNGATFLACQIRDHLGLGMNLLRSAPSVMGCIFSGFEKYPLSASVTTMASLATSSANNQLMPRADSRYNGLQLKEGTVTQNTTLPVPPPDFCYIVEPGGDVNIGGAAGPILTLLPGTIMKFIRDPTNGVSPGSILRVVQNNLPGGLVAQDVTFTSATDDTMGDTNGDGPSTGAPGQWSGIDFGPQAIDAFCSLTSCAIRYGGGDRGGSQTPHATLVCDGVDLTLTESTVSQSSSAGMIVKNAEPVIAGSVFRNNTTLGIRVEGTSTASAVSGNTFRDNGQQEVAAVPQAMLNLLSQNQSNTIASSADGHYNGYVVLGATISQSLTLPVPAPGFCYIVEPGGDLNIGGASGPVLTFLPGTVVKFIRDPTNGVSPGSILKVVQNNLPGGLVAQDVTFTSATDDTIGDTNGDGPSTGAPGQWSGIDFGPQALDASCSLTSCTIRYGGGDRGGSPDPHATLVCDAASPRITDCTVLSSLNAGIHCKGNASPTLQRSRFSQNQNGLEVTDTAAPRVECTSFSSNAGTGVLIRVNGSPQLNNLDIHGNAAGVVNQGAVLVDARSMWWGSSTGPSGSGSGTGDSVSGSVIFTPWLTVPPGCTVQGLCAAGTVVGFQPGSGTDQVTASAALGPPDGIAVPLGLEGTLTLKLSAKMVDHEGIDFFVHENGVVDGAIDENFRVEAGIDSTTFAFVGDGLGGTVGFDLGAAGLSEALYLRITDLLPQEPGSAPPNVGADIDAVEVLSCDDSLLPVPGVTILVHGFNPLGGAGFDPVDYWHVDFIAALLSRFGGGQVFTYDPSTGVFAPDTSHAEFSGTLYKPLLDGGHAVLIHNWGVPSNDGESGQAEAAGEALFAALVDFERTNGVRLIDLQAPGSSKPLHFIGHSRGVGVGSETVQRLGLYGVPVAYFTSLDVHDFDEGDVPLDELFHDPAAQIWTNVGYADSYWQTAAPLYLLVPSGRSLDQLSKTEAYRYNYDLSGLPGFGLGAPYTPQDNSHTRAIRWYLGTISPGSQDPRWYADGHGHDTGLSWWMSLGGFSGNGNSNGILSKADPVTLNNLIPFPPVNDGDGDSTSVTFFNGDFGLDDLDTGLPGAAAIAGWAYHGGDGLAPLGTEGTNRFMQLDAGHPYRTHNRVYIPDRAYQIHFKKRVIVPQADVQLVVYAERAGVSFPVGSLPIAAADPDFVTVSLRLPNTILGTVQTLTFVLVGSSPGAVDIDDIDFDLFPTTGVNPGDPIGDLRRVQLSAYPNPSRLEVSLSYFLPAEDHALLDVFDISGRLVRRLKNELAGPGWHSTQWDGRTEQGELAAVGVYFYRLTTSVATVTNKLIRLR